MKDLKYKPQEIEKKWQDAWEKEGFYLAVDFSKKKKFYLLVEFPYPSGAGLHVGHIRSYVATDAYARKKRMQGFNVLYPMGWDAFGLPAENYAIKTGIHPSKTVPKNITYFKKQIKSLGLSFDWTREIDTTDPNYYKWTQWIFVQLFKNGMAYQAEVAVNWCPKCKTNLADEEVLENKTHERCGALTEKRPQKQWLLRITKYADRLIEDLKDIDYPEKIKVMQRNWIGKSQGAEIKFKVKDSDIRIKVFTTRPDTLYGATFVVISPDSKLVKGVVRKENEKEVNKYLGTVKRSNETKNKTGIFTGSYAVNPATRKEIPIWISDYVVSGYGQGAIMAVPAHDERDYEFAKEYNLEIIEVIKGGDTDKEAYTGDGKIINSGSWNGLSVAKDNSKILSDIEKKGWGKKTVNYHLHDWIFSRQHYWGEPIPIIHCPKCGSVSVLEKDLPVKLPFLEKYQPSGTGESPLVRVAKWLNVSCPVCGEKAKRETDTMPNWAGSNWYFIRYLDPKNNKEMADRKKMEYWLPVDLYQGGFEHTTLHLLYSRFIYKFLFDIGQVPTPEPYSKRRVHGIVLGPDGKKMSKSLGNVISPDEIVGKFGADSLRLYEMFMGPFDQTISWNDESLEGCFRFLSRVWKLFSEKISENKDKELSVKLHQTIKKVSSDIENMKFNTAVASLMEFSNYWGDKGSLEREDAKTFVRLLAPFAPHMAEEIWVDILKEGFSVHNQVWPVFDQEILKESQVKIMVQVNGKLRGSIIVDSGKSGDKDEAEEKVKGNQKITKWIKGTRILKVIFVPGKIINFVVRKK